MARIANAMEVEEAEKATTAVAAGVEMGSSGGGLTLPVFITCLVAASGGLIFGYDIGISGAVATQLDLVAYICMP